MIPATVLGVKGRPAKRRSGAVKLENNLGSCPKLVELEPSMGECNLGVLEPLSDMTTLRHPLALGSDVHRSNEYSPHWSLTKLEITHGVHGWI